MSYDIHLEYDLGGPEPVSVTCYSGNYTSNIGLMVRAAIGESIGDWDGLTARMVARKCSHLILELESDPVKYDSLNPENGWGSRTGLIEFLRELRAVCLTAPLAIVRVWA